MYAVLPQKSLIIEEDHHMAYSTFFRDAIISGGHSTHLSKETSPLIIGKLT